MKSNQRHIFSIATLGLGLALAFPARAASFSGTVERVWEDGFQLRTDSRIIVVDSYDLCGDFTARHISTGEQLSVSGEFDEGEFDAYTLTRSSGETVCP
jgi:hypothetical protein